MKFVLLILLSMPVAVFGQLTDFTFLDGFSGANEVPANSSPGTWVINTLQYDAAAGSFGTLMIDLDFSDLEGTATMSHFHGPAAAGVNAGVLQGLTVDTGVTSGSITGSWVLGSATDVTNLFGGNVYLNLHTSVYGGGELRGQLAAVPEPASASALLGFAVVLGAALRRRRG